MNRASAAGFTIIETMLVLAIGGALTIALLAGAGISIAQQRYRESVQSVQTFLQDGYNFTTVIENNRNGTQSCDSSGFDEETGAARGTTDCFVVGRFITVQAGQMRNANVLAYPVPGSTDEGDEGLRERFDFFVAPLATRQKTVPWGSIVVEPGETEGGNFSVLVIRSPLTNNIITYARDELIADNGIEALIDADNRETERLLCVETDSWFAGNRQGVRIQANATGPGFIDIPAESGSENLCA